MTDSFILFSSVLKYYNNSLQNTKNLFQLYLWNTVHIMHFGMTSFIAHFICMYKRHTLKSDISQVTNTTFRHNLNIHVIF